MMRRQQIYARDLSACQGFLIEKRFRFQNHYSINNRTDSYHGTHKIDVFSGGVLPQFGQQKPKFIGISFAFGLID